MVDSRQKGARAESALVKLLKDDTGLNWKRVPGSGALHADHFLKGDAYVPNERNYWAVEIKHYKDCQLTSNVLTDKNPMLLQWWEQAKRQGNQTEKLPMLFFKHDRSKWFVMLPLEEVPIAMDVEKSLLLVGENAIIMEYSQFKKYILEHIEWIK